MAFQDDVLAYSVLESISTFFISDYVIYSTYFHYFSCKFSHFINIRVHYFSSTLQEREKKAS